MTNPSPAALAIPETSESAAPVERDKSAKQLGRLALIAPVLGLGVGTWLAVRGGPATRRLALSTISGSLALAVTRWQLARLFTEHEPYEVETRLGDLEVRRYGRSVRAETTVGKSSWNVALNEGFRRVAGYIFGGNKGSLKIAMTAPVTATVGVSDDATRTVAFTMPHAETLETLPSPVDHRVRLRSMPERHVAVLSFAGRYGGRLPGKKRAELLRQVRAARLTPIGEVFFAGYDAPYTLPFLRRNEVFVEVTSSVPASAPPTHE
jgi:hypothetical protein